MNKNIKRFLSVDKIYSNYEAKNFKAKSNLNVTERDEEKIVDENNKVVWKEKL